MMMRFRIILSMLGCAAGVALSEIEIERRSDDSLAVVIATYNEIENLPNLVYQLSELLPAATILVIDDNSPDGTGKWCDENATNYPRLNCIHRSGKLGLGSATIAGFAYAMENGFDFVATMDADFSHHPGALPGLVKAVANDADSNTAVAIGSRYVSGGKIEGWPVFRRVASLGVNWFARVWLGLSSRDNSGAFRVYRVNALREIGLASIRSDSYSYLEEVLYRFRTAGLKVVERPILFRDRQLGQTKTDWRLGCKVFWEIFRMRWTAGTSSSH